MKWGKHEELRFGLHRCLFYRLKGWCWWEGKEEEEEEEEGVVVVLMVRGGGRRGVGVVVVFVGEGEGVVELG